MNYSNITDSLMSSFLLLWKMVILYAPKVLTAVIMLIVGYLVAKSVAKLVHVLLNKVDLNRVSEKVGLSEILVSMKLPADLTHLISKLVFFFIFLIFLISTADVLDLDMLSSTIDKIFQYLPNVIGAFFIFFLTAVAGHFARNAMLKTGESLQLDFAQSLGNVIYYAILLIGVVLAIGQLKIETAFLTHVLEILLVTSGVAVALSLGFGSREVSKNLISGVYLKESLVEGATVKVGDFEGRLIAIKPVCFELELSTGGSVILPNSRLLDCEIMQK